MLNKVTGKENKFLEYALVAGQFSGIILIAVTTHFRALSEAYLIVALLGLAFGGYAILVMKLGNFRRRTNPSTPFGGEGSTCL